MNPTDEALMAQVRSGDVRKLALLFERHHRRLYRFFRHLNPDAQAAEDLVQDVFFRILRHRETYDESRPFAAWMYQIARNARAERGRGAHRELHLVDAPEFDEPAGPEPNPEQCLGRSQQIGLLHRALRALPEDKRELLVMTRFQELKYSQIADILGCEIGAVKVRIYRAMRALGQAYEQLSGEKAS